MRELKTYLTATLPGLPSGEHTLEIRPEKMEGRELMKLFEVTLTPVK